MERNRKFLVLININGRSKMNTAEASGYLIINQFEHEMFTFDGISYLQSKIYIKHNSIVLCRLDQVVF